MLGCWVFKEDKGSINNNGMLEFFFMVEEVLEMIIFLNGLNVLMICVCVFYFSKLKYKIRRMIYNKNKIK